MNAGLNQGAVRSSVIAALIAIVAWLIIAAAVGDFSTGGLIIGAIVIGAIALVGTYIITMVVERSRNTPR